MVVPILIATRTPAFGDLIQQTLEHSRLYETVRVDSGAEALRAASRLAFAAAILDCDLRDLSQAQLAHYLRQILPELRLVAVPPDQNCDSLDLEDLTADACLTKPFYLPDLLNIVEKALAGSQSAGQAAAQDPLKTQTESAPAWLEDVERAARYLTRLSLESAAQAALIIHPKRLWAYAGELPRTAAEELAHLVMQYQEKDGAGDMARFVRLGANGGEYMLYATHLGWQLMLALVFDAATPFSKIRSQAGKLARALATAPVSDSDVSSTAASGVQPGFSGELERREKTASRTLLFEDIPPPTIQTREAPYPALPPASRVEPQDLGSRYSERTGHSMEEPEIELGWGEKSLEQPGTDQHQEESEPYIWVAEPVPGRAGVPEHPHREAGPVVTPPAETQSSSSRELLPVSAGFYSLSYACLLVPRMPLQHLTGDLSEELAKWLPQLCIAYGWRLSHLALRPDYIQWILGAPPVVSPAALVQVVRQKTSARIFNEFPRLARDNPSGDFWAPGYLVMASAQPIPSRVVQEFIRSTRSGQGLSPASPSSFR